MDETTCTSSAREELNDLLSAAIALASKLIEEDGVHGPFGMVVNQDGERIDVFVDNTEVRDPSVLADTVIQTIRDMCLRSEVRAVAFAHNVDYRSAQDGSQVDAIQVDLDHVHDRAVTCMLPYSKNALGGYVAGELFAIDPRLVFFEGKSN
jgi:hypothetical protein